MTVYANGMEIASKSSSNKSICAMPDVCLSPPSPPAGPVPIPYPNTAMASDTDGGTSSVKIEGKPAMMKDSSSYKSSKGDEAATNSFGAGVVTHKLSGPAKFAAYSFDVKFEGANVCRLGDITTHNHANIQNSGSMILSTGLANAAVPGQPDSCKQMKNKNDNMREKMEGHPDEKVKALANPPVKANAIAHASVSGMSGSMASASRYKVLEPYCNGKLKQGLKPKKLPGKSERVCPGKPYKHPKDVPPAHLHAEARILESIPPEGHPTVTFAIDWRTKKGTKRVPCKKCEKLIKAACKCMEIMICDEEGNPESQCS